jgi:hypothetical protein
MRADLVSRAAVMEAVCTAVAAAMETQSLISIAIIDAIENAPAADPAPAREAPRRH